jgi:hypothetical protein
MEPFGNGHQLLGYGERAPVVFYNTRTGNQKKIAGLSKVKVLYFGIHYVTIDQQVRG